MLRTKTIEVNVTEWTNPTKHTARFSLFLENGGTDEMGRARPARFQHFEVKPGETIELPSEYDRAIQEVKDGVIVGGLVPWLVRSDNPPTLHPALVPVAEPPKPQGIAPQEIGRLVDAASESPMLARARAKKEARK